MIPQLTQTIYAKILFLLMVVIAGAFCNEVGLQSKCSNKCVRINGTTGKVTADENVEWNCLQYFRIDTIFVNGNFTVTIYSEDTNMFLCFDRHWRIKGMKHKELSKMCHFYETFVEGYFQFSSIVDQSKKIGFVQNGRPINYARRNGSDPSCYSLYKTKPKIEDRKTEQQQPHHHLRHPHQNNNHHNSNRNSSNNSPNVNRHRKIHSSTTRTTTTTLTTTTSTLLTTIRTSTWKPMKPNNRKKAVNKKKHLKRKGKLNKQSRPQQQLQTDEYQYRVFQKKDKKVNY